MRCGNSDSPLRVRKRRLTAASSESRLARIAARAAVSLWRQSASQSSYPGPNQRCSARPYCGNSSAVSAVAKPSL
jgi:hypothetical protein